MQLLRFDEAHVLVEDLVIRIQQVLNEAIVARGQAYLVVSGGKTPIELFKALAKTDLAWHQVTVLLADERCVSLDNEQRNERLVRQFLLQDKAAQAQFVSLYHEAEGALDRIAAQIAALPTFDAVVLGMGEDGHTASLFPHAKEFNLGNEPQSKNTLLWVTAPHLANSRVSLSQQRLLNSKIIFVHVQGQNKFPVLHEAMTTANSLLPVSAFLHNPHTHVQVMYAP